MKTASIPSNEDARLKSLLKLNILDSPVEERFDRYTRLVKRLLNVPISMINLVDNNRLWFKSYAGLDDSGKEMPREISFCGHTILNNVPLIINNTLEDWRFADNPAVIEDPKVRFYSGFPLIYSNGHVLGTLCAIDLKPKELSDEEILIVSDIAKLVTNELETVQLAISDDLTGLSNRRGFKLLAEKSLHICKSQGLPASLIFFDLTGFKAINDKFGHTVGDKALIDFSSIMRKVFRESDIFARLGGDEFVVLLSNTTTQDLNSIINVFTRALSDYNLHSNNLYELKFNHGQITTTVDNILSISDMIEKADLLMYREKRKLKTTCQSSNTLRSS